jgi:crossover junction endodeoxyribonuclease RuvC
MEIKKNGIRILGIDPGSRNTGIAILDLNGKKMDLVHSEVINFDEKEIFLNRILTVSKEIKKLIETFSPDEVALEALIFVKSPTALAKLAQTRGAILAGVSEDYKNKVFEYSPNLIKSSTTGHGHVDKLGVQKFLNIFFKEKVFKTHDESDAILVAVCHALMRGKLAHLGEETKSKKSSGKGLANSLKHRLRGIEI